MEELRLKVNGGTIIAEKVEGDYPFINVYYQPDDDSGEGSLYEARIETNPEGRVAMLIWADTQQEDCSQMIIIKEAQEK